MKTFYVLNYNSCMVVVKFHQIGDGFYCIMAFHQCKAIRITLSFLSGSNGEFHMGCGEFYLL